MNKKSENIETRVKGVNIKRYQNDTKNKVIYKSD